jgi:hypothetical protein
VAVELGLILWTGAQVVRVAARQGLMPKPAVQVLLGKAMTVATLSVAGLRGVEPAAVVVRDKSGAITQAI